MGRPEVLAELRPDEPWLPDPVANTLKRVFRHRHSHAKLFR
ncbi:hypothetical protein NJ7G_1454 [Natrinema sp. J7-2]|nr:hypothetical protein NJ7G_1454 [Natrinema sp. J7-2]